MFYVVILRSMTGQGRYFSAQIYSFRVKEKQFTEQRRKYIGFDYRYRRHINHTEQLKPPLGKNRA